MSEFLVEVYVSRHVTPIAPRIDELSRAAEQLTREGTPVCFVRSILVPADETGFYLFQASSVDAVRDAVTRAGLRVERISEAVSAGWRPARA